MVGGKRGTNNFSFSLYCWLCKNPLSLRLPQYLDLCAFYVHNLKSAKAGSRASEGGRKCAQISGCFPEDSLTYGLRFLEFDRTPNFWQEARLDTRKNSGSSHYFKVLKDCVVCMQVRTQTHTAHIYLLLVNTYKNSNVGSQPRELSRLHKFRCPKNRIIVRTNSKKSFSPKNDR